MKTTSPALQSLIDFALSKPLPVGWVLEARLFDDGSFVTSSPSTIGCDISTTEYFAHNYGEELGDVFPRTDRAYLGIVHDDGAYLREI